MATDSITCPNCGVRIPISKALTDQIRSDLERDLEGHLAAEEAKLRERMEKQFRVERAQMEAQAVKKAQARMRSEVEKARLEARNQAKLAQKLTAQLDASSRQLQGDLIEGRLVDVLTKAFAADRVQSLSRRGGGGDVLQCVHSNSGEECGSIIWESKNTAQWSNGWLSRLRHDQRRVKAEVAVLVSSARPKGRGRLDLIDGVWVTDLALAVGLGTALRSHLIQLKQYRDVTPGTGEKYAAIQKYLASTEFRQRIEAIVEAFQTMRDDLASEKRSAEKHWAQREKHLQMVIENVSGMYGELRAITGPMLARVRRLELPGS